MKKKKRLSLGRGLFPVKPASALPEPLGSSIAPGCWVAAQQGNGNTVTLCVIVRACWQEAVTSMLMQ